MSIRLMTECWKLSGVSITHKMVLLALADNANDDGICWPSVPALAEKCSLTERSVYRALDALEEMSLLNRKSGEKKTTVYHITPDRMSPLTECHPDTESPIPLTQSQGTPDTESPPYIDITINEPSLEPSLYGSKVKFDLFWQKYPKKAKKLKAKEKYLAVIKRGKATHEQLMVGLERYCKHLAEHGTERRYIQDPTTWLNSGSWEDDYGPPPKAREPTAEEEAAAMFARYQARQQASP